MNKDYSISIYLDTRRAKKTGKFPVKLRVFTPQPRIQKLYPVNMEFTEKEFESIWETTKPRTEHKATRLTLQTIETNANKVAEKLSFFSIESFERAFYRRKGSNNKEVNFYYQNLIKDYKENGQIRTASNYELSLKSLLDYHQADVLSFYSVTTQWLNGYERYMTETKSLSKTTVGMYLRPLRAVFQIALRDTVIEREQYPFGKDNYSIPAPKGVKKALTKEQLKKLFDTEPKTPEQSKAKAFWFFSYASNGMNMKDIANLKFKSLSGDSFTFDRAKTSRTKKNKAPVTVFLNDFTIKVINDFGNADRDSENYVFPIYERKASPEVNFSRLGNFIRFVNQHFLNFAESIGVTEKISTYWARHSFATMAIRNGVSMEYVSEALSHSNIETTQNYFAGFESHEKRKVSETILNFD